MNKLLLDLIVIPAIGLVGVTVIFFLLSLMGTITEAIDFLP